MNYPTNARLFELLARLADVLTAEDAEALLRRAGENVNGQEALDLRASAGRALREYAERRSEHRSPVAPGSPEAGSAVEETFDGFAAAADAFAELEAHLEAGAFALASGYAAQLEEAARTVRRAAGEAGRWQP